MVNRTCMNVSEGARTLSICQCVIPEDDRHVAVDVSNGFLRVLFGLRKQ